MTIVASAVSFLASILPVVTSVSAFCAPVRMENTLFLNPIYSKDCHHLVYVCILWGTLSMLGHVIAFDVSLLLYKI